METPQLGIGERALLYTMAGHADADGRNAYASYGTYARLLGCDRRTILRWVSNLREAGYIVPERWHTWSTDKRTRSWRINLDVRELLGVEGDTGVTQPSRTATA